MNTVILILLIFNIGWTLVIGAVALQQIKEHQIFVGNKINAYTKFCVEQCVTAAFNEDSLKQKAEMTGRVEV